jgi:hypothetical protein
MVTNTVPSGSTRPKRADSEAGVGAAAGWAGGREAIRAAIALGEGIAAGVGIEAGDGAGAAVGSTVSVVPAGSLVSVGSGVGVCSDTLRPSSR